MVVGTVITIIIVLNAAIAIVTVFRQPRDIAAIWAWLLVLLLLPVLGFVLYYLFGRKLSTNKLNALATQQRLGIDQMVAAQQDAIDETDAPLGQDLGSGAELVRTLLKTDGALITTMNEVQLVTEREDFDRLLFADIASATDHIHLEAYTIQPDQVGLALRDLLVTKAKAGVRVRLVYDTFGSHRLRPKFWQPLRDAGGLVEPFIATKFGRVNPRINFRNHRKLTIIDGRVGYMGGFDIGASKRHLAIKRDSQLRITGQAVATLQARFFMDWNTTAKVKKVHFQKSYFPDAPDTGRTTMQIVSGGPDQNVEAIKLGYLRLIALAKKRIWIETPYFVPDDSLLDALAIAAGSGVDVRVMVPASSNIPLMTKATKFYLARMAKNGAKTFLYQEGFLHSKTIVVDDRFLSTGTANLDSRSFKLNFEIAAFIYDPALVKEAAALFEEDMNHAIRYTRQMAESKSRLATLDEELSRLLAPIM
ncbi:cardiolipin synthase [Lacticaseibacillus mingshuiensis]|uniref:Cardiolipin synthase n=1 Tax=Lacticaseibacillus mingshuiensis TaxID=2799574 RepID=A0ABW4CKQ2_9LACO|nr:cardiolipin synthase [Lacticaseibacillus mingshuiensis]